MWTRARYWLFGSPLPSSQASQQRLSRPQALAAFSPDALSSVAYANQEIYLGLVVAGAAGLRLAWPIALAITALLLVVALSYFQTLHSYSNGGGSFSVARANLGTWPGLTAGAALLVGYLLTAAVSLTAAVEAIASAFPALWTARVGWALALLLIIMFINLRGTREAGALMSVPVYGFLGVFLAMLAYGAVRASLFGAGPAEIDLVADRPVDQWLVLRTFAAGCTALTGIEAISNGVPAFRPPEARHAGQTLIVMAGLMAVLFAGSVGLTQYLGVVARTDETILSALAHRVLGGGAAYVLVQVATMLILAVAANTSFSGFPRLAAVLAAEGYLPRQLMALGDRLVYRNGILTLVLGTAGLIVVFGGASHALVPLFAVGVFLAFTLSQVGMVVHWARARGVHWPGKLAINGLGALATAAATLVILVTRFVHGAWITMALVPLLVLMFDRIHRYYEHTAALLSMAAAAPMGPRPARAPLRLVVPVAGVHRGLVGAIDLARALTADVTAVHVEVVAGTGAALRQEWQQWWPDVPLVVIPSPYRSIVGPLLAYLDDTDRQHHDGQLAGVVLPELVPRRWWQSVLHNQYAWVIRAALLYRRRMLGYQRVIIDVPYHLEN